MMQFQLRTSILGRIFLIGFSLALVSCVSKETPKIVEYEGPLRQAENMVMYQTEKEKMKVILRAKKFNEFQNGDREFPEGIYIEFYDNLGNKTSTLRANSAYFFKQEYKWRGRGKVEVINLTEGQQLNTEELFWKPDTKKIFTDKFVTITEKNDVIYGTGMVANQDMTNYKILNTSGTMEVKE